MNYELLIPDLHNAKDLKIHSKATLNDLYKCLQSIGLQNVFPEYSVLKLEILHCCRHYVRYDISAMGLAGQGWQDVTAMLQQSSCSMHG
ncbi:hypothetical protein EK904_002386 [Melospiza melodia maxima]|nr:hypothetical protein EK904_002386 [Melospiza melodia maxima]